MRLDEIKINNKESKPLRDYTLIGAETRAKWDEFAGNRGEIVWSD